MTVVRTSRLRAPAAEVWAHATRMTSINEEMRPFLRMTYPREAAGMSLDGAKITLGEPLFPSWVLALGVLPVERMQVTLVELEPGRRLVEQSKTLVMKSWRHERTVDPDGDGSIVTDRLTLEAPIAPMTPVIERVIGLFFDHRHRQLRRRFGAR